MAKDTKNTYTIEMKEQAGVVAIADEVIAVIAGLAAMEIDGVASMAGNTTRELISKLGVKSLSKGVKVEMKEGSVVIYVALNLKYGYSIMDVSKKVQEKIKSTVETMIGLQVSDVNVRVAGVEME